MSGTKGVPQYYWDACLFLSLVENDPEYVDRLVALLELAQAGKVGILTSVLSIAEVAYGKVEKENRALSPDVVERIDALWAPPSPVAMVEVHDGIVRRARQYIRDSVGLGVRSLKPMDAIHLATAADQEVDQFHTIDQELLKAGPLCRFGVSIPPDPRSSGQPGLFPR